LISAASAQDNVAAIPTDAEPVLAPSPSSKPKAKPADKAAEAAAKPAEVPEIKTLTRGPVTNLPMPRFVSLKATKANARRGPSLSHRIDWVFKLRGYPLEVIAEYGHWRRVRDFEDATGWVHYSLISGVRTALVVGDTVDLHSRADLSTRLTAQAAHGAILRLHECTLEWCRASADGHKGWLQKTGLWGIGGDETLGD
jgi:SH3-like domain-containing protein